MIIDFESQNSEKNFNCDIAVVGAGAVGVLIAVELVKNGFDVLLIEGGGTGVETKSQDLNLTKIEDRPMSGLSNARFRLLGGSTNFWGGQILRFDASIFKNRPWLNCTGWPFGLDELDRYYDQAAVCLGLPADFTDDEIYEKASVKKINLGSSLDVFLTRCLLNRSTAHIFKNEIHGNKLRTLIHANVISFGMNKNRVENLEIRNFSGKSGTVKANRVVLTAGTVEIARLLLSPDSSGRDTPWSNNQFVGAGFIDHIEACAGQIKLKNKKEFHENFDNIYINNIKYLPRIKLSTEAQKQEEVLDIAARFEFRSQYKEHLANMKIFVRSLLNGQRPPNITQLPAHLIAVWKVAFPLAWRYISSKRSFNPADSSIDLMLICEQMPTLHSQIQLGDGLNAVGARNIRVKWTIDGCELKTMAVFAQKIKYKFEEMGIADVNLDNRLTNQDPSFLDTVTDYYHQMGGARIGPSEKYGVVDKDLKVFGSDNLFVAGAAVYPVSGFANPTFTAMALGLRLADHLSKG
ncbi:MAG: hypothetical protein RLZZ352_2251 [Pseudomonadota bacterium]|jgi:hypothetical protein